MTDRDDYKRLDEAGLEAAVRECARITAPEISDEEFAQIKADNSPRYRNTRAEMARTITAYLSVASVKAGEVVSWRKIDDVPKNGGTYIVGGYVYSGTLPPHFVREFASLRLTDGGPVWSLRAGRNFPIEYWHDIPAHPRHSSALVVEPVKAGRISVPDGQTPLNDELGHRYLDVIKEGATARDTGAGSPYHGHSLEHCLHATGWVQRDLRLALDQAKHSALVAEAAVAGWRDDPTQDERWSAGCDFAMAQLCNALGVDPGSVNWDAATETVDGDVQSVIWNILRARMGEDWDPDAATPINAMRETLERLVAMAEKQKAYFFVEQAKYPCIEDYVGDDGMLTLPDEISPLLSHTNANGRYSEADWWLSTLRSMHATANQSDGGVDYDTNDPMGVNPSAPGPSDTPPAPQAVEAVSVDEQWLWRVFNLGFPLGHEDSSNRWGEFQIISHEDALRLAGDDEAGAYEFAPYRPIKSCALLGKFKVVR